MKKGSYRRILVPLDGSRPGEKPIDYAVWLAQKTGAELILMRVYSSKLSSEEDYLKRMAETITQHSPEYKISQPGVKIRTISVSGDPASQILKYADENEIDLITMSTHGHSGIRHWLLGSVADRVVSYSNRPVRLVKPFDYNNTDNADGQGYDQSILVLLDGSELAEQILPYAAYHAALSGGELVLMSVCEPAEVEAPLTYHLLPQDYPPERPLKWEKYVQQETEKREKECRLYLEQQTTGKTEERFKVRYEYRFGKAAEEITSYLGSNPVSLVAMTTRGRSGLSRWVFGSVAEKVLSVAKSPLLVMRPVQAES